MKTTRLNDLNRKFTQILPLYILGMVVANLMSGGPSAAEPEGWYTYNRDNARSAATTDAVGTPLVEAWVYQAPHRPAPAWSGPAKWDGWNKVIELKDRMVFDKVFHVAAVGDSVFFGSSIDDKVYCLDAVTGAPKWAYFTEGPVRLAPSVVNGRVYVGSDDGHVYCLDAETGKLIWKQRPGPKDRRIPGNGRMVSQWPVRSGVVVVEGMVYCCAGVFPTEVVYLVAMDAEDGEIAWKTSIDDLPAQGYMLASTNRLYVATGRARPVVFDRETGKRLFQVEGGGGGTYALLAGDSLLYGPGKRGEISLFGEKVKDQLATFAGNHMIVTPGMSYLHTDTKLSALDRAAYVEFTKQRKAAMRRRDEIARMLKKSREAQRAEPQGQSTEEQKQAILTPEQTAALREELALKATEIDELTTAMKGCAKWEAPCDYPLALIQTGTALFAGGIDAVAAFDPNNGAEIWQAKVNGNVYGLAAANGRMYVSTDEGTIHCFASEDREAR